MDYYLKPLSKASISPIKTTEDPKTRVHTHVHPYLTHTHPHNTPLLLTSMSRTAGNLEMFPHTLVDSNNRTVLSNIITVTITVCMHAGTEGKEEKSST